MLITQVTVPFWRGHAWRRPHFEPGVGCMRVCNHREHCFHSDPSFDFFSWLLRLTLDSREPVSDTGGNVSNYTGSVCEGYLCMSVFVLANHFFEGHLQNPTVTKKSLIPSKASDMCLRCHLTRIRVVLDGSEGHRLVYSNWQHFYEPIAWREPGTGESNGSNLF